MAERGDDDWYDSPRYYDLIFDEDTGIEADFLEAMNWRYGIGTHDTIFEPACGSGRLVAEMARRGYTVDGFDLNQHMLDFANERLAAEGLEAELWQDTMENFTGRRRKKYDLAHCLVSTFKYILDEEGAEQNLRRVAARLHSGGLYIIGLHLTNYSRDRPDHERWAVERDGLRVVSNTRTWPADRKTRTERLRNRLRIERDGKPAKTLETHWQFRTYNAAQLAALIGSVPEFELVACHDFHYQPEEERLLDDSYEDIVLILRRR